MAYLELSKEAYDDVIKAAGARAGQVAKVCNTVGVWDAVEAAAEAPPDADLDRLDEVTEAQKEEAPLDDEMTDD